MSNTLSPIDISNKREILDLVEEVEATKKPRELKRGNKVVAVLNPTFEEKKNPPTPTGDYQTSLAAIGSWSDLNADELIETISRWRNAGTRSETHP